MPLLDVHEVAIPETRDVISDARDLEELRVQWLELWRRCPHATPFQSPDWLLPWWRNLGTGTRLRVVTLRGGERRLLGVAAFAIPDAVGSRLEIQLLGTGVSDYGDVLAEPDQEPLL